MAAAAAASSGLALWIGAAVAGYFLLRKVVLRAVLDPREPRAIATAIPFVSSLGWVARTSFALELKDRYPAKIYTLLTPKWLLGRLYVVNSNQLIHQIQSDWRAFPLQVVLDKFSRLVCDLSPAAVAAQSRQTQLWLSGAIKTASPTHETFRALHSGDAFIAMSQMMLRALSANVQDVASQHDASSCSVNLFECIREHITIATTEGVYGTKNPYRDSRTRQAFWTYNDGVQTLSIPQVGKLLAPAAVNARSSLASTFYRYFSKKDHLEGSLLPQQRYEWYLEKGFPLHDLANLEAGMGLAILSNTVPTACWMVYHVFSDPTVLQACRAEIQSHVQESETDKTLRTLNCNNLTTSCPIFSSTLKEVLRVHSIAISMRHVMQDHMLDNKYLLKKDSIIWMPAAVQHTDPAAWGPDAPSFIHDRFARLPDRRRDQKFYRPWGGGSTLCPGRRFATTEIMIFTAMLILRFDLVPRREEQGAWPAATSLKAPLTNVMPMPDEEIEVEMRRRGEDRNVRWEWKLERG